MNPFLLVLLLSLCTAVLVFFLLSFARYLLYLIFVFSNRKKKNHERRIEKVWFVACCY